MNIEDALKSDSSRVLADMTAKAVVENPEQFETLIDLSFTRKSPISWRAARVADLCTELQPDIVLPYLSVLTERFPEMKCDSLRRSYSRLLIKFTDNIPEEHLVKIIDKCSEWIMSQDVAVAVKANCMQILYNISEKIPELKNELILIIEDQMPIGTAGLKSKGKTLLKLLYKSIRDENFGK